MIQRRSKKIFHLCMVIVIVTVILFSLGIMMLKYQVEGESNLPIELTKIVVVSNSDGVDIQETQKEWDFTINQNNDIYLYIEKNQNNKETEVIEKITISNFNITKMPQVGKTAIYKPHAGEGAIFENIEQNKAEAIEYIGDLESNIKNLKIGNQGGLAVFRYATDGVAKYKSNETEVNHSKLLSNTDVTMEQLQSNFSFDITIKLVSGKAYKATVVLDTPVGNIKEEGTSSVEITDLKDVVFKRIEN